MTVLGCTQKLLKNERFLSASITKDPIYPFDWMEGFE